MEERMEGWRNLAFCKLYVLIIKETHIFSF